LGDHEGGRAIDSPRAHQNPKWIARRIRKIKRYFQKHRAEKKKQDPTEHAARSTANATWVIAGFTGVTIAVGALQYCTFNRQLTVMKGTLDEMRDEQRPWVYADLEIGGRPYRTQSDGFGFPIKFVLHNTGHLPALYVSPDIEGYLSGGDGQSAVTSIRDRQKKRCDSPLQQPTASDQIGVTVFPNQTVPFGTGIGISATEVDVVKKRSGAGMVPLVPWGVGCIRYRTTDGVWRQTGIAFSIGMTKAGQPLPFVLPLDPTTVDPDQLVITPWIEGGTAYAN
jgi:hypothetical protein